MEESSYNLRKYSEENDTYGKSPVSSEAKLVVKNYKTIPGSLLEVLFNA